MDRYKKTYSSKWQNQYTEEFKRHVCDDYMKGHLCRQQVQRKYKLGNSRLTSWLKELGYPIKQVSFETFPIMPTLTHENEPAQADNKIIQELKRQLEDAHLLAESYKKMIDIAEQELKINIRKKSNTK